DVLAFVLIYFLTMVLVVGGFDAWMLVPFLGWIAAYAAALCWFVPRLAKVSQSQADARALMTGRIVDAYTNISTVKLFSHAGREAEYAKEAMEEFRPTVYRQMGLATILNIELYIFNIALLASVFGIGIWLWLQSMITAGAIAAA